jgi:hypothetical protein
VRELRAKSPVDLFEVKSSHAAQRE